jgi:hypothetical protein
MSYTILAHVATGDLATAALQNALIDDLAVLKVSITNAGDISAPNAIVSAAQGNRLGTAVGDSVTPLRTNTNVLFYDGGGSNWAGIGTDTAGAVYVVTGTFAPTTRIKFDPAGNTQVAGRMQFGNTGGMSPLFPAWRNTGARMEAVLGDNSNWASVAALNYFAVGTGNSLADLTVTGATNFQNGVTLTGGNITGPGYLQITGVVYPGRVDTPGSQGSWYLASHGSFGLYTNTGLYIAGALTVIGQAYVPNRFGIVITGIAVTAAAGQFILCSGTFNVTLPAPTAGSVVDVKNYGTGVITVVPSSGSIDLAGSYVLSVQNMSVTLVADGGNWWIR